MHVCLDAVPLSAMGRCCGCTVDCGLQAVPGCTQYEPRSLTEHDKENLLTSEGVALFLERVWPRCALACTICKHDWRLLHSSWM